MKVQWEKKYTTIAVYVIIVALVILLLALLIFNLPTVGAAIGTFFTIIMPFIVGFAIAYLLSRPARYIEQHWLKFIERRRPHPKVRRTLAIVITYLIALGILVLIVSFVIPQLFESLTALFVNVPVYLNQLEKTIVDALSTVDLATEGVLDAIDTFKTTFLDLTNLLDRLIDQLPSLITSVGVGIFNFFVGLIVSVYVLYSREKFTRQGKKIIYSVFKESFADKFMDTLKYSNNVFLGYIMGTLASTAFVAIATFLFLTICQMPYALLITVIIAVTNLIPFFGPIIGAVPSIIILFIVDPWYALFFLIFILVLQQIDGNIILPKLIGMNVGISAFWVLFALLLGGGLFGFWGLILAVPVFAVIYALITALINSRLEKKGVPKEKFIYPRDIYFEKQDIKWSFFKKNRKKKDNS